MSLKREDAIMHVTEKRKVLEGRGNYAYAMWVNSGQNYRLHKVERLSAG